MYRSRRERILGGVAGGLADYFGVDVSLVRLIWAVLALFGGGGVLAYIVAWMVIPSEPAAREAGGQTGAETEASAQGSGGEARREPTEGQRPGDQAQDDHSAQVRRRTSVLGGLVLILVGVLFLTREFMPWLHVWRLWPVLLVVAGVLLLLNR